MIKCALQYFLEIKSTQMKCWFFRGGEIWSTRRKTSRSRVENQQTQPTYDAKPGNRTWATLVGGECSDTAPILLPNPIMLLVIHVHVSLDETHCMVPNQMAVISK